MAKGVTRKEKLSIYLAKSGIQTESALLRLENTKAAVELKVARGRATLHVKREEPAKVPEWSYFLSDNQNLPEDLFGRRSSVGAVLVFRIQERVFLLCFGTGYHLLKGENIERDFGLRVTLNSVDPDKLRSLDKASFESNPLNSRTQSTRDADVYELHIDSEMDLLYALTGTSTISCFGETVTGRDALTITREVELDDLPDLLEQALNRYEMQLPARFDWVENIHKVKSDETISVLEMLLDDYLADAELCPSVWIGEPEIIDWEGHAGYSFEKHRRAPRHPVLKMSHLRDYLLEQKLELKLSVLKAIEVHANDGDYHPIKSWSVYQVEIARIEVQEDFFRKKKFKTLR